MVFDDPFALLGLAPGASPSDVRAAYLVRAKALHPDATAGNADEFKDLVEAYKRATVLAREWPCEPCGGTGRLDVRAAGPGGFGASRVSVVCRTCGGTGKKFHSD